MSVRSKATRFTLTAAVLICGSVVSLRYYSFESANSLKGQVVSKSQGEHNDSRFFEWSQITPTKDLRWNSCFDGLECARLSVPMDHYNPSDVQAAIAIIRKASPLGPTHADYRGPILFNPGGPGGSGVDFVKGFKDKLHDFVGQQFDVVSFDPRGIGRSIPHASFFRSHLERIMWETPDFSVRGDISRHWAKIKVINSMARENDDGNLRYINTDQTARDMLSIVRAHGREKLQYWGFSYGSILGSTFATLFPDKVERLVIDGICDPDEYFDTSYFHSIMESDKVFDNFISSCHQAGHNSCRFWAPTESDIRRNVTTLFDTVRSHPVSVTNSAQAHGIVDIDILTSVTHAALNFPFMLFSHLAEAYAALAQGDGSLILAMDHATDLLECPIDTPTGAILDGSAAVFCNDGAEVPSDLEATRQYVDMAEKRYPLWAPFLSGLRMQCIDWPKFPKTNFRGPFNATTSHPLLIVGNTADPVTPLYGAHKVSAGFTGSVVLTQDSPGHTTLFTPSVCAQSYIRTYFVNGTLPEPGTVCSADTPLFPDESVSQWRDWQKTFSSLPEEGQTSDAAIQGLRKANLLKTLRPFMFRGGF